MGRKGRDTSRFPAARIKKIMRSDEDVGKINAATPLLVSSALEQFLKSLVLQCVVEAKNRGGKKLMASHLKAAVNSTEKFDFLKDIVANVADPVEAEDPEEPKKKRKRRERKVKTEEGGEGGGKEEVKEEGEDEEEDEDAGGERRRRKPSISNLLNDDDDE